MHEWKLHSVMFTIEVQGQSLLKTPSLLGSVAFGEKSATALSIVKWEFEKFIHLVILQSLTLMGQK